MYVRGLTKALDHHDVRDLIGAEQFALKRGKPMTATINIHPKLLNEYPEDIGRWISWLTNNIRIHCQRAGFGYYALWVRENYEGDDRREHLHLMLHLPEGQRDALEPRCADGSLARRTWCTLVGPSSGETAMGARSTRP
jgi:hypothetical protein